MKRFHSIRINVFAKPEDNEEKIKSELFSLIPFDLQKEKIELKSSNTTGFGDRKIKIFEINLQKQRHTDAFYQYLLSKLNSDQKMLLIHQKESRLDDRLDFYIRLEKERLLNGEYFITDEGNCFHIKISIAAFPAKREVALKIVDEMLS
jgi:RNA-binding protein